MTWNYWEIGDIKLRPIESTDAHTDYFQTRCEDSQTQIMFESLDFPYSYNEPLELIENFEQFEDNCWLVIEKEGEIIGEISVCNADSRMGTFYYGIRIAEPHRGKGYGKKALRLVLDFYFFHLRYQKANAYVFSYNKDSIAFHEKMGFKKEGVQRRMVYYSGDFHDRIMFGLTKEEFLEKF